jgi:small-conductance mechanosensitive channel
VGNVLSIVLPSRDEPIRQRRQSGSLKQFIIAFVVSYAIGYLVNAMLIWRVFAAQELTQRLGNAIIPAILIVLSSAFMWILLTVLAVALSQQPKIRRVMQKEITDYKANAEMKAYEQENARATAKASGHSEISADAAPE